MFEVSKSPSFTGNSNSNANSPNEHVGVVLGIAHTLPPEEETPLKIALFGSWWKSHVLDVVDGRRR